MRLQELQSIEVKINKNGNQYEKRYYKLGNKRWSVAPGFFDLGRSQVSPSMRLASD
jgi:hypothetical protein